MRKVIVMTAILALTACGQESNDKIEQAKAASHSAVVQVPVAHWALELTEGQRATITDTTGRLLASIFRRGPAEPAFSCSLDVRNRRAAAR